MSKNVPKISFVATDRAGCSYYRIVQIRNELNNRKLIKCYDMPHCISPLSDIIVWQRYRSLENMHSFPKDKVNLFEVDDNFWEMPEYLKMGGIEGNVVDYWKENVRYMNYIINLCDGVITTNPVLADDISQYTGINRDKIHIIQNYINFNKLDFGNRSHDGKIRIAWTMDTRRKDFDILPALKSLKRILSEYKGQVKLIFFGDCPTEFLQDEYKENIIVIPFNPNIEEYYRTLQRMAIDIGIAPAQNTQFNHCKSALKVCEFGALGLPVVASNIYPYRDEYLLGGKPSGLFIAQSDNEWYDSLKELIDNKIYRLNAGLELYEYMLSHYSLIDQGLDKYMELFKSVGRKDIYPVSFGMNFLDKKILYIVSSKDRVNIKQIKENVARFSKLYAIEVVLVENKGDFGLDEVYNQVIKDNPNYDYYIFAHDDIAIIDDKWLDKILKGLQKYDIVGVAGGVIFDPMHGMWSSSLSPVISSGCVAHKERNGKYVYTNYGLEKEVLTVDGCFMACKNSVVKDIQWQAYNKFHFYDIDFCLKAHDKGYKIGVTPIAIAHNSSGQYNEKWLQALGKFREQWGYNPFRLNKDTCAFDVLVNIDTRAGYHETLNSLERQSIKVNIVNEIQEGRPYLILNKSVVFFPYAFEALNMLIKMNVINKIQFKIGDDQYILQISEGENIYKMDSCLGVDYYKGYSYVGKY